jgi:capsular exopolysaccharide synthesis family protein
MGKTHEALERTEKEFQENLPEAPNNAHKAVVVKRPGNFSIQTLSDRFQGVKIKLATGFPLGTVKTILFAGIAHGDGCTTTAVSFAKTMAENCRLNVLLIDANLRTPKLHEVFNVDCNQGVGDLLNKEKGQTPLFKKVGHGNLCLLPCGHKNSGPLTIFESTHFDRNLKLMREKFDYVILDGPPISDYAETKVMGQKVDGMILVINSGKTRRQVAAQAKQEMEAAGTKILGVILNRRKNYIPNWIYQKL